MAAGLREKLPPIFNLLSSLGYNGVYILGYILLLWVYIPLYSFGYQGK